MQDIKFDIKEELGILSESGKGWTKELNLVSWNGSAPKYDLRDWSPEHEKMGKGITLSAEEVQELYKILSKKSVFQYEKCIIKLPEGTEKNESKIISTKQVRG